MVQRNPHTGAELKSRNPNQAYLDNFDKIFRRITDTEVTPEEMPDEHCASLSDGSCVSEDPRCMHSITNE